MPFSLNDHPAALRNSQYIIGAVALIWEAYAIRQGMNHHSTSILDRDQNFWHTTGMMTMGAAALAPYWFCKHYADDVEGPQPGLLERAIDLLLTEGNPINDDRSPPSAR